MVKGFSPGIVLVRGHMKGSIVDVSYFAGGFQGCRAVFKTGSDYTVVIVANVGAYGIVARHVDPAIAGHNAAKGGVDAFKESADNFLEQ